MAWIDLDKLLREISLVEVAQRLGREPRPQGGQKLILCPFHAESNPSVVLYEGTAARHPHFHCFSCGQHGDAIALVKQVNGTDFKNAVNWIASTFNVSLTPIKRARQTSLPANSEASALEIAAGIYASKNSASDLESWARARKFKQQIIYEAGLTYAKVNTLADAVTNESFNQGRAVGAELEEASLIKRIRPKSATQATTQRLPLEINYTDAFPGERIIIPLKDEKGKLIGLVARSAKDDTVRVAPKYLNSKGTEKGRILFFANVVFPKITDQNKAGFKDHHLYLTEGYFDALRLNTLSVSAVAVMGAQISERQVELINQFSDSLGNVSSLTVHLFLDGDLAGIQGAARSAQRLLGKKSNIELEVVFPTRNALAKVNGADIAGKDPDDWFRDAEDVKSVTNCIKDCSFPPALAFLIFEFGGRAEDVLNDVKWDGATRSRRYRALQRASKTIRKLSNSSADLEKLIFGSNGKDSSSVLACQRELLTFAAPTAVSNRPTSTLFITDYDAQLNHARELAYMGSRRGELPCAEPEWERLNIAATAFNFLLKERLAGPLKNAIDLYDAVKVPRKFGGKEARLKAMPRPADLIVQQYILNELLSERLDEFCLDDELFSNCIPAVRYYGEGHPTVTTGLRTNAEDSPIGIDDEQVLSFAYQIDMEVIEGRKPASDQGMYRPYVDSWRDFMKSLKSQAEEIGVVHSVRLDVKRYYDNLQRFVVRDSLLINLNAGLDRPSNLSGPFAPLIPVGNNDSISTRAAQIVDAIADLLFGYGYESPDDGSPVYVNEEIGIPQGPVLSAWIGNIALFPIDQQARILMKKHNGEGRRIGYARYVDDLVLLADSAELLIEVRRAIDGHARALGLSLVAKSDDIPVLPASEFYAQLNEGRAFAASGPAWEPPMIGDGEQGWGLWAETTDTDRQSALQIFRNSGLFRDSGNEIVQAVSTAFKAKDLRPSELAKGARWLWFAVATDAKKNGQELHADEAWRTYLQFWERCIEDTSWQMDVGANAWEDPILFALEGLEKLLDASSYEPHGLSSAEKFHRDQCIAQLGNVVLQPQFNAAALATSASPRLQHQLRRRYELLAWKASRAVPGSKPSTAEDLSKAHPYSMGSPFVWLDRVVQGLMRYQETPDSPQDALAAVENPKSVINRAGFENFNDFATAFLTDGKPQPAKLEPRYLSIALQTIVSVAPRESVWCILAQRPWLLGNQTHNTQLLILPPLPGIPQDRLLACGPFTNTATADVSFLVAFSLPVDNQTTDPMDPFLGVGPVDQGVFELPVKTAPTEQLGSESIVCKTYSFDCPSFLTIPAVAPEPSIDTVLASPQIAARLYQQMIEIWRAQFIRNESRELVPAWPFVANAGSTSLEENSLFLLAEAVDVAKLAGRAFVRDVGRSLRSISVPQELGYLWRIGVTVSDILGLQDDIAKLADHEGQLPLNESTLADPGRYVLRSQLRKLRGAYFNEQAYKRIDKQTQLPLTIKRSLEILQNFPNQNASFATKLYHLLISESETEAMKLRYLGTKDQRRPGLVNVLHLVSSRVIGRLPVAAGESLPESNGNEPTDLRRDLLANIVLGRRILALQTAGDAGEAEQVFRASLVLAACYSAFRGLVISLKALPDLKLPIDLDWPAGDWPTADSTFNNGDEPSILLALRNEDWRGHTGGSALTWLCVLVGVIKNNLELKEWEDVAEQLKLIAGSLAKFESSNADEDIAFSWPFEQLTTAALASLDLDLLDRVGKTVPVIDRLCGIGVRTVVSPRYGYSPKNKRFTDSEGRAWSITPSSICQWPLNASKTEETVHEDGVQKIWCETYEKSSRKLLSVHVLGDSFARIAIKDHDALLGVPDPHLETENGEMTGAALPARASLQKTNTSSLATGVAEKPDILGTSSSVAQNIRQKPEEFRRLRKRVEPVGKIFREIQNEQWSMRGFQKLKGHVRVALLQWKLDETYSHPIAEAAAQSLPFKERKIARQVSQLLASLDTNGKGHYETLHQATEKRGTEYLWTKKETLPSWAEHRRQRLLATAIDVCQRFKVDILVLPEYSVRPETVAWLKEELRLKGVAVLAGTFRQFDAKPNELLSAKMSLLWPYPNEAANRLSATLGNDSNAVIRADRLKRGVVLEWERLKKYRAVAVEEYIQPSSDPLNPLFHPGEIFKWFQKNEGITVPSLELNYLLTSIPLPLKFCLELICSELFMLTSPANLLLLVDDYAAQLSRFQKGAVTNGWETVSEDLLALSRALTIGSGDLSLPRRSLLLLPTATSRTADYWIAGQAGLLAAGTTTVFCNGVLAKAFLGGSCFVGRESWKNGPDSIGLIAHSTPYHGWSKGIYYNKPTDPLGESDQAMVIADIDPLNMQEGKPRPQMLPVPLQLVAYLPVAETIDATRNTLPLLRALLGEESNAIAELPQSLIDYLLIEPIGTHDLEPVRKSLNQAFRIGNVDAQIRQLKDMLQHFSPPIPEDVLPDPANEGKIERQVACLRLLCLVRDQLKMADARKFEVASMALGKAIHAEDIDSQVEQLFELEKFFSDKEALRGRTDSYSRDRSQQPKTVMAPAPAVYDWLQVDLTLNESEKLPSVSVPSWVKHGS